MTSPAVNNRQIAMVLDLNKCLNCQTCTVACKKLWNQDAGTDYTYWNNVETLPGTGYPKHWSGNGGRDDQGGVKRGKVPNVDTEYGRAWNFNHDQVHKRQDGKKGLKVWLRPDGKERPKWGANWDEDHGTGSYPEDNHYFYLPRLCNHCTHPACLDACPRGSIYKRSEDGIVLVDQDRCHGYRFCVEACPYKKVYYDTHGRWRPNASSAFRASKKGRRLRVHGNARGGCASSGSWTTRKGRSGSWCTSGRSPFRCTPNTGFRRTCFTCRR